MIFKKRKNYKVQVEINLEDFNELVSSVHSTIDQLDNNIKKTQHLRSEIHRLSQKLDKDIKRINNYKFKTKVKNVEVKK
ncbi:hypothetical protein [Staphylococcus kloosii]|uniref:t-SNARE coiled-coil homology domain-containing protein n=1 Tax=Staphylococcus kloosii TaxID=29384 RepID=A0ABQ0XR26_9STAP|nr:hypothetical protein [Staphylococcus kloosii]AVQ35777.1 hypothetical protein C7J89_06405 [Staphylococcus kloosii]PNZ05449.1 hypothetical protein CD136_07290 [Staphylococcus kloosii]GEP82534.1 hypothetical protein SKL01_17120 [Staphylococcus kloosii]SUM48837.1 Uncharacterised protein [Staphylococcus kloosii]